VSPFYVKPFVKLLRSEDSLLDIAAVDVDVILVPSYSAINENRLAKATRANMETAIRFNKSFCSRALIVFSGCSHAFPMAEDYERLMKVRMCNEAKLDYQYAGPITNSVNEMEAFKRVLRSRNIEPARILIVTCELHSGSERILAGMIFPAARIFVRCNSHEYEVEPDHPTADQRSWLKWLKCSILRFMAFQAASAGIISLNRLRKRQHAPGKILTQK